MATINGIAIKAFREFSGIEYPTIREANIWKDGKKIGTFREDEWGGPAHFTEGLEDAVRPSALLYQKGCKESPYKEFESSPESFVSHLLTLAEYEKEYKKNCKRGYNYTLFAGNDHKWISLGLRKPVDIRSKLPSVLMNIINREFPKGNYKLWHGYHNGDFNLTIDENNHVPNCLERMD